MSEREFQQMKLGHNIQDSLYSEGSDVDANRLRRGHTSYSLFALVAKFGGIEQQSRCYGTDVEIFNAEIHMIMAVHDAEGIHVGGLAEKLRITKASASELLRKLERKGLVCKKTDPAKLSRLNIFLTDKGRVAHERHILYHEQLNVMIDQVMCNYTPQQVQFLSAFFADLCSGMDALEWD